MTFLSLLLTCLLLAPPIALAAFWRAARLRHARLGTMPDNEALILARVGGIVCGVLPVVQLLAGVLRYKTGEAGQFLWYLVPAAGVAFTVLSLAGFLAHAKGLERTVSSALVLLAVSMLLLITFIGGAGGL